MIDVVELMAREALHRMVQKWGIEGAEQKIKEICSSPSMAGLREYHLNLYNRVYRNKII